MRLRLATFVIMVARRLFKGTWIQRLPMTDWAYRRALGLMTGGSQHMEVAIRGVRLAVPPNDITLTPTLLLGDYETTAVEAFMRLVPTGGTVIDVGANIGLYSLLAASAVGPTGAVYAFEPIAENADLARHNIDLNHVENIRLIQRAVGHHNGTLTIYRSPGNSGTHSAGLRTGIQERVTMVSLDSWVADAELTRIDAVKIDVEGYDGFVVEGALRILHDHRPTLLIEWMPPHLRACAYEPDRLAHHLFELGGECLVVDERRRGLYSVSRMSELAGRFGRTGGNLIVTHRPQAIADLIIPAPTTSDLGRHIPTN